MVAWIKILLRYFVTIKYKIKYSWIKWIEILDVLCNKRIPIKMKGFIGH